MLRVAILCSWIAVCASTSCPSSWSHNDGKCLWPKQQSYANQSVANSSDPTAACCALCAASGGECVSWLLYKQRKNGFPASTCILNNAPIKGSAPDNPACVSGMAPPAPAPPTPKPSPAPAGALNVLFLAVDDLRPELNAYGEDPIPGTVSPPLHTPHIDALAAKSLLLKKNYVQQAVCSPTRQSLLTGRRPDRTRVYDLYSNFRTVGANYTTIPEHFTNNGYKTIGMGKIFHPGHASGANVYGHGPYSGDDTCCSWSNHSYYYHAPNLKLWSKSDANTPSGGKAWMAVPAHLEAIHPLPDNQTAHHAVQIFSQLSSEFQAGDKRPFFLAVGFHKPHLPFIASEEFFNYYPASAIQLPPDHETPPTGMPPVAWSKYAELRNYVDQSKLNATGNPGTKLPDDDVLDLRRAYYAAVTQTDAMLGKVIAALEASPFKDNTVIAFWGDHGWQLGEHGEWCKHTNFEYAARAPMMVHVPGLTDSGVVTEQYSEHVDLFPTLTEAAMGIKMPVCPQGDASFKVPFCTEGSSLVPLIKDPKTAIKQASFSQYPRGYQSTETSSDFNAAYYEEELGSTPNYTPDVSPCILDSGKGCTMGYTLVTRAADGCEYRYTEWADFNTEGYSRRVNWDRNVGTELYNHTADPGENHNLAADAQVAGLAASLSKMLRAGPKYGN